MHGGADGGPTYDSGGGTNNNFPFLDRLFDRSDERKSARHDKHRRIGSVDPTRHRHGTKTATCARVLFFLVPFLLVLVLRFVLFLPFLLLRVSYDEVKQFSFVVKPRVAVTHNIHSETHTKHLTRYTAFFISALISACSRLKALTSDCASIYTRDYVAEKVEKHKCRKSKSYGPKRWK